MFIRAVKAIVGVFCLIQAFCYANISILLAGLKSGVPLGEIHKTTVLGGKFQAPFLLPDVAKELFQQSIATITKTISSETFIPTINRHAVLFEMPAICYGFTGYKLLQSAYYNTPLTGKHEDPLSKTTTQFVTSATCVAAAITAIDIAKNTYHWVRRKPG